MAPPSGLASVADRDDLPRTGNPEHIDTTQLLINMEALLRKTHSDLEALKTPEDAIQARVQEETDKVKAELSTPMGKLKQRLGPWWSVIQWVAGAIAAVFVAGMTYKQFVLDNATVETVTDAIEARVEPVEERVTAVEKKIDKTSKGVTAILAERAEEKAEEQAQASRREDEALLQAYRDEYQELLQEYTADKAAGRRAERPRKTPEHIKLETQLDPRPPSARMR